MAADWTLILPELIGSSAVFLEVRPVITPWLCKEDKERDAMLFFFAFMGGIVTLFYEKDSCANASSCDYIGKEISFDFWNFWEEGELLREMSVEYSFLLRQSDFP